MNHTYDILIVGCEARDLDPLSDLLQKGGYVVRTAHSSELALKSAAEHPPCLMLLKARMPVLDGFELCRRLRDNPPMSQIAVILMGSSEDAEAMMQGVSEGAADFITTPFLDQEILVRVKTHVRMHMLQQHLEELVEERTAKVEALRKSDERFRQLMEQSPMDIVIMSPEGKILEVNAAWMRNWDVQTDEVANFFAAYNMRTDKQFSDLGYDLLVEKAFEGENIILPPVYYIPDREFDELGLERIKAKPRWVQTHIYPVTGEDGNILYVVCTNMDVTEQKEAAEQLEKSESRLQGIMEQSPLAIELINPDGKIVQVNNAWRRLWRLSKEESEEFLRHYNIFADQDAESRGMMPLIKKAFAGEPVVLPITEYDIKDKHESIGLDQPDVNKVWIQCHLAPVFDPDGNLQCVVNAYVDLTEKTKVQQEKNRILNLSPDLIAVSGFEEGLIYTNPVWQDVLGYTEAELNGKFVEDFVLPEDRDMVMNLRSRIIGGDAATDYEIRCVAKDGSHRYIAWSCIAAPDEKAIYAVGRDITKRKRAEQEAREQRDALARVERVTSMGQLAGSISHELNQPLTGILSNAQAAEMMVGNDRWEREELLETLADIAADAKRAGNVMRSLRDIFRKQKGAFDTIDVNKLVEEALQLLHGEFVMQDIHLNVQNAPADIFIYGNKVQLQQVLLNLLINGAEAMCNLVREERCLIIGVDVDTDSFRVWVDDNGRGIDSDKIGSVFEPLATWKPGGTGMGLAISDSIIRAHGGEMWAENRAEGGARVGFSLPLSKE